MKHITQSKDWDNKNLAEKGFTLVELLVVIAILGILAVVGVLAFSGLTGSAKTAVNETELAQVKTAVDAYRARTGNIPTGTAVLTQELKVADLKCTYTIAQVADAGPPAVSAGDVAQSNCPA